MKPNEVRVGNWVKFPNGKEAQLEREDFSYHRGLTNIEHLEPILVNKIWLFRFGFEPIDIEADTGGWLDIWDKRYGLVDGAFRIVLDGYENLHGGTDYLVHEVCYVHQVQNIYFELTGQDLIDVFT